MSKLFLILIALCLLTGCSTNCTSGRVLSKEIVSGIYYVTIDVTENFVFTGEQKVLDVSENFWHQTSVGHGVTICPAASP